MTNEGAVADQSFRDEELLAAVVADLIGDVRHVAVGNASPIPATASLRSDFPTMGCCRRISR